MTRNNFRISISLAAIAACAVATNAIATNAVAQEAAGPDAAVELPPVIVEGATIEVTPIAKPKPKPVPVAVDEPAPEPKSAPAKKAKTVKKAAASPQAPNPADAATPAEASASPEAGAATSDASPTEDTSGGLPLEKVGASVSVLTNADLKARQVRNAADALRSLPGVSVSQQGTPAGITVVRIRGAESNHTLVLIDGVEVNGNDTDGFFDFSNLTTEEIERIEVLRGPQSGLYGTGAIGGVINITTKSGKGPLTLRAMGEAGSFGTQTGAVQISGGTDRAHAALTVQKRRSDGFDISPLGSERDGSEISSLAFKGGILVFDKLKLDGSLRLSDKRGDRDGFDGSAAIGGLAVANDDLSTFTQKLWTGRLAATLDTLDGHWIHQAFISRAKTVSTDTDASFLSFSKSNAEAITYGYTNTLRIDGDGTPMRHFLTGRVQHLDETFEQPTFNTILHERGRTSAIGELRGEYFENLFLTGTIRQDWNDDFDNETTWHASASLKVPGTIVRLHSSTGTGVKYPSFTEQFGSFFGFTPNLDLMPETSIGWDGGAEATLLGGKAIVDVTYFDQNLQNEIATKFLPNFTSTVFNRDGESSRRGIEVSARAIVFPGLTVGGAYTYLVARDDTNLEEIRRPPHSGKIDANYAFLDGKANVNLSVVYNGDMKDVAFQAAFPFGSERVTLDSYWLVNVAASYTVQPGVELFGRVENLLDQNYQEVYGYETAGIAAYAGVRLTYEEPSTKDWVKYK